LKKNDVSVSIDDALSMCPWNSATNVAGKTMLDFFTKKPIFNMFFYPKIPMKHP